MKIQGKRKLFIQFLAYPIALVCFFLTLESCDPKKKQTECVEWIMTKITLFTIQALVSTLIITILLWLGLYGKLSRLNIIGFFICVGVFYYNAEGSTTYNHGEYNFIVICLILIFFNYIAAHIACTLQLKKCIGLILAILTVLGIYAGGFSYIYFTKIHNSCKGNWDVGLKGSKMIQNQNYCYIDVPEYCWYDILDGLQDISGWMGETCENNFKNADEKVLNQFYHKTENDSKVYAYPRFESWGRDKTDFKYFSRAISQNIKDYSKLSAEEQQEVEVVLDETGEHPKINLTLTRNEKLAKTARQKQIAFQKKNNSKPFNRNVFWFYIDAVSRQMIKRKLGKLYGLLEDWYNQQNSDYESFQFFRYYSLAPNTAAALLPLDFGVHYQTTSDTKNKNYMEYFREAGFVTGFAKNNCGVQDFDLNRGQYEYLNLFQYDHSFNGLFCDPNYFDVEDPYSNSKGPFSARRRCLYGKDTYQYVFEYAEQFWKAYPGERKFMKTHFSDHHEWTGEVVKYMDNRSFEFFSRMFAEGQFKDTTVVIAADHGLHMAGVLFLLGVDIVMKQRYFPMFYFILPRDSSNEVRQYLQANEQAFFTGWDIRKTLIELAQGKIQENDFNVGQSLISEKIKTTNYCEDVPIQKPWDCHCLPYGSKKESSDL